MKRVRAACAAVPGRLLDALSDPRRRGQTVVMVLGAYCLLWTLYAVLAKASQDIHFDMGEMVAWSREVTFGTPKHPPLPAWLAGAWFRIFALAPWAYYLLSLVTAAVALWVAFTVSLPYLGADVDHTESVSPPSCPRLSRASTSSLQKLGNEYVDGRDKPGHDATACRDVTGIRTKSAVGLALLTLVPFFNFHALKYNANSAMMPWWALTTWFFLRSFESRSIGFAVLAGIAAAGAMMVKYWSVVLLAALVIAALIDRRRGAYFKSAAPYVTVAAGVVALSPHLAWLYLNDFVPFRYALETHPGTTVEAFLSGLGYLAGALGYAAAPILLTALVAKPARKTIADMLWPSEPSRRLAATVFTLPLLLPALFAVVTDQKVVSLWAIASMTLLPVVLLSPPRIVIARAAAVRVIAIAIVFPPLAIVAAPVVAIAIHRKGTPNYGAHYRLVAEAARKVWYEATDRPLRLVGSYDNLLYGSVFYFPDRPSALEIVHPELTPWIDATRIARNGILLYCPAEERRCMDALDARAAAAPPSRRVETDISRTFLGIAGPSVRYVIVAIPPR